MCNTACGFSFDSYSPVGVFFLFCFAFLSFVFSLPKYRVCMFSNISCFTALNKTKGFCIIKRKGQDKLVWRVGIVLAYDYTLRDRGREVRSSWISLTTYQV